MQQDVNKLILEKVKSGDYFIEARKWYNDKYLSVVSERSVIALIATLMVILFIFLTINIMALYPTSREVRFVIESEDTLNEFSVVKSLGLNHVSAQDVDLSIAKYLAAKYVLTWEYYPANGHTTDQLLPKVNFIKNNSSRDVYKIFQTQIVISNPDSPLIKYRDKAIRNIFIKSVKIEQSKLQIKEKKAIVLFDAVVQWNDGRKEFSKGEAQMLFSFTDPESVLNDELPIDFVVINYTSSQLS